MLVLSDHLVNMNNQLNMNDLVNINNLVNIDNLVNMDRRPVMKLIYSKFTGIKHHECTTFHYHNPPAPELLHKWFIHCTRIEDHTLRMQ